MNLTRDCNGDGVIGDGGYGDITGDKIFKFADFTGDRSFTGEAHRANSEFDISMSNSA